MAVYGMELCLRCKAPITSPWAVTHCSPRCTALDASEAAAMSHLVSKWLRRPLTRCVHCLQLFRPRNLGDLICCRACGKGFRAWARAIENPPPPPVVHTCADCGEPTGKDGRAKLCTACSAARVRASKRRYRQLGKQYKPRLVAKFQRYGTPVVEMGITWRTLVERDGPECTMCGRTTHPPDGSNDPGEATVGHRIALAQGGNHSWQNCHLECRGCNVNRRSFMDATAIAQVRRTEQALQGL
ncbi:HNH endonuclease [Tateyamaria sp.]|uniref:HNH endonuclease n=1 Tax=Tateyamaria sp. TaxID=1929288 RepID=UPI0039B9AD56